jgi:RimJ/RimL family protein N-acetyltransferase
MRSAEPNAPTTFKRPLGAPERRTPEWVPINSLSACDREAIVAHLSALSPADRYLRFGYGTQDRQIVGYVDSIDFEHDEVFGIFNRQLQLIAMAHLAYARSSAQAPRPLTVEFGVSVLAEVRGRGYGARLFDLAIIHARNRGTDKLFIQALTENKTMLSIARKAGATVEHDGSESQAWLQLPPDTLGSQLEEAVGTQAAELNYQFKRHALRLERLLGAGHIERPGGVEEDGAASAQPQPGQIDPQ